MVGRKHCENSQELVSGIGVGGMLLQLSCGDELDQTQLGGIRPYHGLDAATAGWLVDGKMRPSTNKGEVPSSISLSSRRSRGSILRGEEEVRTH